MNKPLSISINGVDNVGKTTQLSWLQRAITDAALMGSIDAWDARWREVSSAGFSDWWFKQSSTENHAGLILSSHASRRAASPQIALEDRGLPMLRAVCAATAVLKDKISIESALLKIERLAARLPAAQDRNEIHVLLRRYSCPEQEALEALRREKMAVNSRYAMYQRVLAEILYLQESKGNYNLVLETGNSSILEVQQDLREKLKGLGVEITQFPAHNINTIWIIGGLSESGKSTVGELLRDEHGVTRLKIGYLLDIAALRAGVNDPYDEWSEQEQSMRLTEELLFFASSTKANTVSLESAHRFHSIKHLKKIWGNCCKIVYIKVSKSIRNKRTRETESSCAIRDLIKTSRGAHLIENIADYIIDNSMPLVFLKFTISKMASEVSLTKITPYQSEMVTNSEWLKQAASYFVDSQVALILATGSTGSSEWQEGWSDIDLLIVRDEVNANWLKNKVAKLRKPQDIKVAISAFTLSDIRSLRVPPRVIQSLRDMARGVGVIYRREDLLLTIPSSNYSDRCSRGELGLVLMLLRRIIADNSNLDGRSLYKHLLLVGKIILRADGYDYVSNSDVFVLLAKCHPGARCYPPSREVMMSSEMDFDIQGALTDAADNLLAYIDKMDQILVNGTGKG